MNIFTYNNIKSISKEIPANTNQIIPIVENIIDDNFVYKNQVISSNLFVKNLQAYARITSLPAIELPDFGLEDSETDKLYKVIDVEWNSPRKQVALYISTEPEVWHPVGSMSLLNPAGYPYRTYNLQDLYTDALAIELGSNAALGLALQDVGHGLLEQNDTFVVHGSFVQELIIDTDFNIAIQSVINRQINITNNTLIVPSNPRREYLIISNLSTNPVFINFNSDANIETGLKINPEGNYEFYSSILPYFGSIYAISGNGQNVNLAIMEASR